MRAPGRDPRRRVADRRRARSPSSNSGVSSSSTSVQRSSVRPSTTASVLTSLAVIRPPPRLRPPARCPRRRRSGTGFRLIAVRISARLGLGVRSSSATADMQLAGRAEAALEAVVGGERRRAAARADRRRPRPCATTAPSQAAASVRHDSTARPSRSTVQLPHVPSPQATLVPVSARSARSTSASDRCGATSSSCMLPVDGQSQPASRARLQVCPFPRHQCPAGAAGAGVRPPGRRGAAARLLLRDAAHARRLGRPARRRGPA